MTGFRRLDERVVHEGHIITVAVGEFEAPDGTRFSRDVVHHPGAVAAVPIDDDEVVLVRQYRSALDTHLLEIPAGIRDIDGEPIEDAIKRELVEEVGLAAGNLEHLASVHNTVGFCDELIEIFVATDLTPTPRAITDSPEELEMSIVRVPLVEVPAMIATGQITDAKTIIGVLAALRL